MTTRTTNLLRICQTVDKDFDKQRRVEDEYNFFSQSGRIFKGTTAKRGPYASPATGFLKGSHPGVTSLPGD